VVIAVVIVIGAAAVVVEVVAVAAVVEIASDPSIGSTELQLPHLIVPLHQLS
jgi:hypothetical protein